MVDPATEQLGDFLKARRGQVNPASVGVPAQSRRRRVPGLRREEVAQIASISPDYYMRLEQGRRQASVPVLEALANALQLSDDERTYMFELSGKATKGVARRMKPTVLSSQLERILGEINAPAFVLGRRMDVLAWNPMAAALVTDFGSVPVKRRNYALILFTDPAMRSLHTDWDRMGRACVSMLRMEAGRYPHDKRMAALVGELSMRDNDFRTWWADHHVAERQGGTKRLRHPVVGDLTLRWDTLTCDADSEQQLVVWTAEPGSLSFERLKSLSV